MDGMHLFALRRSWFVRTRGHAIRGTILVLALQDLLSRPLACGTSRAGHDPNIGMDNGAEYLHRLDISLTTGGGDSPPPI